MPRNYRIEFPPQNTAIKLVFKECNFNVVFILNSNLKAVGFEVLFCFCLFIRSFVLGIVHVSTALPRHNPTPRNSIL